MKRTVGWMSSVVLLAACSSSSEALPDANGNGANGTITGGEAEGGTTGATGGTGSITVGVASTTGSPMASATSTGYTPPPPAQTDAGCEKFVVQADRATPDMLIVMDASGSMAGVNFGGQMGVDRWTPAVGAVNTLTGQLEDSIQFGLMMFPAGAQGCNAGQLDVPMDLMNAQPIADALAATMPQLGQTPTSATLQAAREVLAEREPVYANPETPPLPQYIMLVTDGDPNCVTDMGPGGGGMPDPAAQQAAIDEIAALAEANVKTYVVGIDTAGTDFESVLDEMAVAGATGDMAHRSVSSGNADALIEEFNVITQRAVSCSFVLSQNVDPEKLIVYIDGEPAEYGADKDWVIRDDMRTVELLEGSCNELQLGAKLEAEVVCEVVNVI